MSCKRGYEKMFTLNGTGRCLKICKAGSIRNPITFRCQKLFNRTRKPRVKKILNSFVKAANSLIRAPKGRKDCILGYEINPQNGKCRKSCQSGYVRNLTTQRCRKVEGVGKKIKPIVKKITSSIYKTAKSLINRFCKPGFEKNPENGKCRKACNPGYIRHPSTQRCRKIAGPGRKAKRPMLPPPPPSSATSFISNLFQPKVSLSSALGLSAQTYAPHEIKGANELFGHDVSKKNSLYTEPNQVIEALEAIRFEMIKEKVPENYQFEINETIDQTIDQIEKGNYRKFVNKPGNLYMYLYLKTFGDL